MKKNNSVSLEDITKKEISIVEANDKLAKLEKEKSRDKKIIAEYIRNQLEEDYAADQMSIKEYVDPFTGDKNKKA